MARRRKIVEVPERRSLPRRAAKDTGEARAKAAAPQFTDDSDDDNPKNHFARKQKAQPANEDEQFELDPLSGLPREIFYLIAEHLDIQSLLNLPHVCKSLHKLLMSKSSASIWKACAQNAPGQMPPCPADLSWPSYLTYMSRQQQSCTVCGTQKGGVTTYFKLRVSLCWACEKKSIILEKQLESYLGDEADENLFDYCHSDTKRSRVHDYRYSWFRDGAKKQNSTMPRRFFLPELRYWHKALIRDDDGLEKRFQLMMSIRTEGNDPVATYHDSVAEEECRKEAALEQEMIRQKQEFVDRLKDRLLLEGVDAVADAVIERVYYQQTQTGRLEVTEDWKSTYKALLKQQSLLDEEHRQQQAKILLREASRRQENRRASVVRAIRSWLNEEDVVSPFAPDYLVTLGHLPVLIADDQNETLTVSATDMKQALQDYETVIDAELQRAKAALLVPPAGAMLGSILDKDAFEDYISQPSSFWKCTDNDCNMLVGWPDVLSHRFCYHYDPRQAGWSHFVRPKGCEVVDRLVQHLEMDQTPNFERLSRMHFVMADAPQRTFTFGGLLDSLCRKLQHGKEFPHVAVYTEADRALDGLHCVYETEAVWACRVRKCDVAGQMMTLEESLDHVCEMHPTKVKVDSLFWRENPHNWIKLDRVTANLLGHKRREERIRRCLGLVKEEDAGQIAEEEGHAHADGDSDAGTDTTDINDAQ